MEKRQIMAMIVAMVMVVLMGVSAWAVPPSINFQGKLLDAVTEEPITDPGLQMIFRIYDADTGGSMLWEETQSVPVNDGMYDVTMGLLVSLDPSVFSGDNLWLEVEVDTEVLTPRQLISSVSYAMRAGTADDVGGLLPTDIVTSSQPSTIEVNTPDNVLYVHNIGAGPGVVGSSENNSGVVGYSYGNVGSAASIGHATNAAASGLTYGGWFRSESNNGIGISGESPGQYGIGVQGWAPGSSGTGVWGKTDGQYGIAVRAEAGGSSGMAVRGDATSLSSDTEYNYGGVFTSSGIRGRAVHVNATGAQGVGIEAYASATGDIYTAGGYFGAAGRWSRAVYGDSSGLEGVGVEGKATGVGDVTNYGGYFSADGRWGRGVTGLANGWEGIGVEGIGTANGGRFSANALQGRGVFGEATGDLGVGVWGEANSPADEYNYGGVFKASGVKGGGVHGESYGSQGIGIVGFASHVGDVWNTGGHFTANGNNGVGVAGVASATGAVQNYGALFSAAGNSGIAVEGVATATGEVTNFGGNFKAYGNQGIGVKGVSTGAQGIGVYGSGSLHGGYFEGGIHADGIYTEGSIGIEASNTFPSWGTAILAHGNGGWAGMFHGVVEIMNGYVKTPELRITGGSDLSERFDIREIREDLLPSPGMVVSIDPESPGDLMVSSNAYDRRVAGIISGAGGVKPGMLMGQEGTEADGSNPVALTGRVYCFADSSQGAIEPGDLLTTSDTPGHAMKVADYPKAQGAIIGKAMSSLESGKGLVLVLVSLQ